MSCSRFIVSAAIIAVLLPVMACRKSESQREAEARNAALPRRVERDGTIRLSPADRAALNLAVAPVAEGVLPAGALRFGKVQTETQDDVVVPAPVTGRVSASPSIIAGMPIAAGTTIASISPAFDASERVTLGVQAADIEGQIAQLEKEVRAKDAEAARTRELGRERIVSVARQQTAAANAASAHARLDALRREREAQRQNATQVATVRAPMGGTLAEFRIATGSVVHQGDVLARIVRPGERFIDLPVGANEPAGHGYSVLAVGTWIPARLAARGAMIDADGFRHDRIVVPSAPVSLLPGAAVSVRVSRGAARGLVVPDSAIIPTSRGDLVYVQKTPDTFQQRVVHVAERAEAYARVDQGLAPGEVVVVRGVMGLYGESVRSALE
jgi:RND family efflux transporter MFP subunit